MNDNCKATRALQRNGEPKPLTMEPIELPDLKCLKCDDHYLLRDSMKGLFLAASQYPKNRETRAPSVEEIKGLKDQLLTACRFLPNKEKHLYLLDAPEKDNEGNHILFVTTGQMILIILLRKKMEKRQVIQLLIMR
jgi:DNA topoisomerase-1